MIQRIQSLWLLLAAACLLSVPFLPVGKFVMEHGYYLLRAFSWKAEGDVAPLNPPVQLIGTFSILGGLLSLIALFLFKKRSLQMKTTLAALLVTMVLAAGMAALFIYFRNYMDSWVGYGPGVLMPLLSIVLNTLAYFAIRKDDEMVKSLDRIR